MSTNVLIETTPSLVNFSIENVMGSRISSTVSIISTPEKYGDVAVI